MLLHRRQRRLLGVGLVVLERHLDLPQKIDDPTFIAQEPLAAAKPHPIEAVQNTQDK